LIFRLLRCTWGQWTSNRQNIDDASDVAVCFAFFLCVVSYILFVLYPFFSPFCIFSLFLLFSPFFSSLPSLFLSCFFRFVFHLCSSLLNLFGIRKYCLRSGRSRSLYLLIRRVIKQIVVIMEAG